MKTSFVTKQGRITLYEATPANAPAFRDLRLEALQDNPIAFSADYQKNLNQPLKHWEDLLTMHLDESTVFLANHETVLVGMAGIARGGSPKTRHSAWIWGVYVRPQWRGMHIAEELIRSCFTWAAARGIVIAKLGVAATNTAAVRCYERCGFRTYGTEPRALLYDASYYDFYMMACPLDNS